MDKGLTVPKWVQDRLAENSISLAYKRCVDFEMLFSRQRETCVIVLENKIVSIGRVPVLYTVGL